MKTVFASTARPVAIPRLELSTVYFVESDNSYDVVRTDPGRTGLVALRTLEGSGILRIAGHGDIPVGPQNLLVFANKDVEAYRCDGGHWIFWWFEFASDREIALPLNVPISLPSHALEAEACQTCLRMLGQDSEASAALASATMGQLYQIWFLQWREQAMPYHPYGEAIHRVVNHLRMHVGERMHIKDLAGMVNLGERRFQQIFKLLVGKSPKVYQESIRDGTAVDFLSKTAMTVTQIADHLGYSSPFHFSKAFTKAHGFSPSEFRRQLALRSTRQPMQV